MFWKKKQKGAALLQAMLAVSVVSAVVASVTTIQKNESTKVKDQMFNDQRTQIARRIESVLRTPEAIERSADLNINNPGNKMLYYCLGKDYLKDTASRPDSLENALCDPSREYSFLLTPGENFYYGESTNDTNCPNKSNKLPSQDISCFIAGEASGKKVGYDFSGNTGTVGENFPLEAKAFFQPICDQENLSSDKEKMKPCHYATDIKLRYELIHHKKEINSNSLNSGRSLGTFPKSPLWYSFKRSKFVGNMCNPGATTMAFDDEANLECRCYLPYHAKIGGNGQPLENSRGPICELKKQLCQKEGEVLMGQNADGTPVCKSLTKNKEKSTISWELSTESLGTSGASCYTHNNEIVGGWMSSLKQSCRGNFKLEQFKKTKDYTTWEKIAAGAAGGGAVGVMGGGLVAALAVAGASAVVLTGGIVLAIIGVVAGAVLIGNLLIDLIFGKKPPMIFEATEGMLCGHSSTRNIPYIFCPNITCTYYITCTAFK